jgi:hypothetical protein
MKNGSAEPRWKVGYRLGGVAALITVLVALLDIILSFLPGERDVEPGRLSATEWFARFEDNRFLALRDLGLWNIVNTILAVPVYSALYGAHRRAGRASAALAAILSFTAAGRGGVCGEQQSPSDACLEREIRRREHGC